MRRSLVDVPPTHINPKSLVKSLTNEMSSQHDPIKKHIDEIKLKNNEYRARKNITKVKT